MGVPQNLKFRFYPDVNGNGFPMLQSMWLCFCHPACPARDPVARLVYRMLRFAMEFVDRGEFYEAQHRLPLISCPSRGYKRQGRKENMAVIVEDGVTGNGDPT